MELNVLREYGPKCIDLLVKYHESIRDLRVAPEHSVPGEVYNYAIAGFKKEGEDFKNIWKQFAEIVVPNLVHWQHPNFLAFYPANVSSESIIGELLSAGLGIQAMYWFTSPAAQELEIATVNLLCQILNLPKHFNSENLGAGALNSSSSESAVLVLSAAREALKKQGFSHNDIINLGTVYVSDQTHTSIHRAFLLCGYNPQNWRVIETSDNGMMEVDKLHDSIKNDCQLGMIPVMVVGTIGTTNTCSVDDISAIGDLCVKYKVWCHVDAAYALAAAVCPEYYWLVSGIEKCTSIAFNCHKWLLTNFDCSCLWVADKNLLNVKSASMSILENSDTGTFDGLFDLREFQIPLGRRFRCLKLYFTLRSRGIVGLQDHIKKDILFASQVHKYLARFQNVVVKNCFLGVLIFNVKNSDEVTKKVYKQLHQCGYYINGIVLKNQYWLRLSFASVNALSADIEKLISTMDQILVNMGVQ